MTAIRQDIRYAVRMLWKSPGFTAVAVLSLALGIGVNTAVFSLTNGVLYKALPVRDPHQLRLITWTCDEFHNMPKRIFEVDGEYSHTRPGNRQFTSFSYVAYLDFARQTKGFCDVFAFSRDERSVTIDADGVPTSAQAQMVSGNFFQGYGASVLIGRPIMPEDDRLDAPPVTVLSYRLWERAFGLDPHVIGQTLRVGETGFTVIGVLPRRHIGPVGGQGRTDLYVPLAVQPRLMPRERWLDREDVWWVRMMGRLAPGADEARMQASLEVLFRQVVDRAGASVDRPGILLQEGRRGLWGRQRREWGEVFWGLQIVVGLVLLIACTNLAGLLLARGTGRQQEMAVRAALGAGRWRLIRQSLMESLVLSLAGVCLGLLFSTWVRGSVSGFVFDPSGDQEFNLRIDVHVLLFALGVGVVTAFLSGLLPAWRAGRTDPATGLKEITGRGAPRLRLGKVLVTAQMGMSVLFVVVGGLLCRTLINLYRVDPGFDTEDLLLVPIEPGRSLSPPQDRQLFFDAVRRQIGGIPGVRSVAFSSAPLASGGAWSPDISIPGRPETRPRDALMVTVSDGYFATMGIRLLQGRDFLPTEMEDVVIVNEEFARAFFPEQNPLGRFMAIRITEEHSEEFQIVGLCGNHQCVGLRERVSPAFYRPYSRHSTSMICLVRSVLPPLSLVPAVRRAVAEVDPSLLLEGITTQKLAIKESLRSPRLLAWLFGSFAVLALALCCIGLYGLMAYNVARRTGEMGIRKALGARSRDVAWAILREALTLTAIGVAIGLPVALAVARVVRSSFYGIEPHDPITIIGAIATMAGVAVLAAWMPVRRAARIDPMAALRCE